jgi:hypothetical protein
LPGIVAELAKHVQPRVLDLGSASGSNVNFFARFGSRLSLVDLRSQLAGGARSPVASTLLSALRLERATDRYDLVLAWDLFDYLAPDQLELLGARLSELSEPATRLFCFLSYRADIPQRPRMYWLQSDQIIVGEDAGGPLRPSPRLKEQQLVRALQGFEVENSYLLRNGLQEYVMVRTH